MDSLLITTLTNWLGWFRTTLLDAWSKSILWVVSFWGTVTLVSTWIYWAWDKISGSIAYVLTLIDAIQIPALGTMPATLATWVSVANTFFPLQHLFTCLLAFIVLLAALKALCIARRMVGWFLGV